MGGKKRKEARDNKVICCEFVTPAYAVSSYVLMTVTVVKGTPSDQVSEDWEKMLFKALALWQQTDKAVCHLQPNDVETGEQIYTTDDAPQLFQGWDDYFHHKDA